MNIPVRYCAAFLAFLVASAMIAGCERKRETRELPAPEVVVSLPTKKKVTEYLQFTGTTRALESVELRARVKGWLESVNFQPGQRVKKGELLFLIDPRMYQAQVDQYQAQLKGRKADLELQATNLRRATQLLASASISQLQYDVHDAKKAVAQAQVGITEADLAKAKLDLDYTRVTSPINGKVSRNYVDAGNLVGASTETLLATVVDTDSIYAYFNVSERDVLRLMKMNPPKGSSGERSWKIPAHLALSDETDFPHVGAIDYVAPELDPNTGTLQARAVFPNKNGELLPGFFVRVRVAIDVRKALLVPALAVGTAQAGEYVLVVNKDNVVEQQLVKTGQLDGELRVIEKGLKPDDWVVVNGIQRARPGGKVKPRREGEQTPAARTKEREPSPPK